MTDYTPGQLASHIFAGLPEDLLEHRRDDLVARCRTVRADGWDNYRYAWSTSEVVAVAYLLDSRDVLTEMSEERFLVSANRGPIHLVPIMGISATLV